MSKTIENLLTLARFNKYEPIKDEALIKIETILSDIIENYSDQLQQKNLKIHWPMDFVSDKLFSYYYASLILDNIIGNSIKYSKEGGDINIQLEYDEKLRLICKISDQGIGIKSEDLPHVFTPFFRSDALEHKNIQGDGLGLSIAVKAAEAINAAIFITSEHNIGTTVKVVF